MIAAVAIAVMTVVVLAGRGRRTERLEVVLPRAAAALPKADDPRSPLRIVLAVAALLVSMVMVGGISGAVTGIVAAVVVTRLPTRVRRVTVPPDGVPVVADLVAGCLAAGATLPDALDAAASAAQGVLAARCHAVAAGLRAGLSGPEVWQTWYDDPHLASFARTAARTSSSGAAAAADFHRAAARLRSARRSAALNRVRQSSVWLVVPLGLCFLPAFVLVAVVPIVLGLFPSLQL